MLPKLLDLLARYVLLNTKKAVLSAIVLNTDSLLKFIAYPFNFCVYLVVLLIVTISTENLLFSYKISAKWLPAPVQE